MCNLSTFKLINHKKNFMTCGIGFKNPSGLVGEFRILEMCKRKVNRIYIVMHRMEYIK